MITAKQARESVDRLIEKGTRALIKKCEKEIKFGISQREYEITFETDIPEFRAQEICEAAKKYLQSEPNNYEVHMEEGKSSVLPPEGCPDEELLLITIRW